MNEKVETPNTQLQKVTLLVAMHDYSDSSYDVEQLDAGEWLLNVLMHCADKTNTTSHLAAAAYLQAAQVLETVNCEVVVSNGL
jgi:hypothetical protein